MPKRLAIPQGGAGGVPAQRGEPMTSDGLGASDPFELWHFGSARCLMSPRDGQAPFTVTVRDGDRLVSLRAFDDQGSAIAFAVEALRVATTPNG